MEQLSTTLKKQIMTYHDMTKEMKYHDISHDISSFNKEMISKNDYIYLVQTLESWRVFYPKAQIKKYGARACWEAMQRVKSSNPRVPGAYFTITVRNLLEEQQIELKQEIKPVTECNQLEQEINKGTNCTPIEEKPAVRENRTTEKTEALLEATTTPKNESKKQKGKITLPNITKWQEAREFLFKLSEYDMTNDNVVDFVKKIKRQYNFA